ncbi:hypothetical protein [Tenacibaculum piscium]|uniref:Lipoprotein n=1 Tax=Tenacibaculum piscium TaxID=1458515 RepID=A0A2H1YKP6_9FLAO|nr:hypothetical protein [Tenacibaculum piscium]MBE7629198.1 hypothetical protein [Tenacibaculum piscium]MBE7669985.1 hypothetical protein [Tenacibaculum piscium]MBE7690174.1 hypothetical protein [Tenacibaculum piscium]SOS76011.1 conserved exported hypothetical protein [Tenacibaculum piscium]
MKNLLKPLFIACSAFLIGTTFTGCSEEQNELAVDPDKPVIETPDSPKELVINSADYFPTLELTAEANTTLDVVVKFSDAEKKMKRLYITKNVYGSEQGAVAYDLSTVTAAVKTYGDGAINLGSLEGQEFTYKIPFEAPTSTDGVVVYKLWTTRLATLGTTSKGDFRDVTKRNAYEDANAFGTITIKAGTGSATATTMKQFSAVILAAPLADGSSKSFISVYNGETYAINAGLETASFWDFGYYYGNSHKASFASASDFPKAIVDIADKSKINIAQEPLNNFYIAKSTKDFDNVTATELETIVKPTSEKVTNLSIGSVLEFQDKNGAKGLIKVTKISGTNGNSGKIYFDVKIQNVEYIKL